MKKTRIKSVRQKPQNKNAKTLFKPYKENSINALANLNKEIIANKLSEEDEKKLLDCELSYLSPHDY
ncbi:hypothetical protein [Helicobacter pylori]|uniref:hypothetical protein n=1 Tax=Helicobacter pylori TaxID=210 RepID=UPI000EABCC24|nr:hypothetical protein [Helicobacter pylori]